MMYSSTADNIRDMVNTMNRNMFKKFMYRYACMISSTIRMSGSYIEGGKAYEAE